MVAGFQFPEEKYLLLGKVSKAHGLRGEVKVHPFSGSPGNLSDYDVLHLVKGNNEIFPCKVLACRVQGPMAIVRLQSVDNRNDAEAIEGCGVLITRDQLPAIAEDEFYYHQFIGKLVFDINGVELGKVDHLFSGGAQDIMVIRNKGEEYLVPVTREIVVEEREDSLTIDPPPGLLDINREN